MEKSFRNPFIRYECWQLLETLYDCSIGFPNLLNNLLPIGIKLEKKVIISLETIRGPTNNTELILLTLCNSVSGETVHLRQNKQISILRKGPYNSV
jgi:hypothetical protein